MNASLLSSSGLVAFLQTIHERKFIMSVLRFVSVALIVLAANLPLYAQKAQTEQDYNDWLSTHSGSYNYEYTTEKIIDEYTVSDYDSAKGRISSTTYTKGATEHVSVSGGYSYKAGAVKRLSLSGFGTMNGLVDPHSLQWYDASGEPIDNPSSSAFPPGAEISDPLNGFTWVKIDATGKADGISLSSDKDTLLEGAEIESAAAYYQLSKAADIDSTLGYSIKSLTETLNVDFLTQELAFFRNDDDVSTEEFSREVTKFELNQSDVNQLANLKSQAEQANNTFNSQNQQVAQLAEKLQEANSRVDSANQEVAAEMTNLTQSKEKFDSVQTAIESFNAAVAAYESADFGSYEEQLAAYEDLVTTHEALLSDYVVGQEAVATAQSAYDDAQSALERARAAAADAQEAYNDGLYVARNAESALTAAEDAYQNYQRYGSERQLGDEFDQYFNTATWDINKGNEFRQLLTTHQI
jgi:hypothetical protein